MRRRTRTTVGLLVPAVAAVVLVLALAGGGGSSHRPAADPFAWLHPAAPPAGWHVARIADGAAPPYPPGWRPIRTDPGTASVALLRHGRIEGFLNATPRQGAETLANWSRFRPEHNRGEGDRGVRLIASSSNLTFRAGRGSCVIDDSIGTLFFLNFVSGVVIAAGLVAPLGRVAGRHAELVRAGFAVAGIGLAVLSLVALFISESSSLFNFTENGYRTAIVLAIIAEAAATVFLVSFLALSGLPAWRGRSRS